MGRDRFHPLNTYKNFKTVKSMFIQITAIYVLKEKITGFARAGPFTVSTGVFFSGYSVPQVWCKETFDVIASTSCCIMTAQTPLPASSDLSKQHLGKACC